MARNHMRQGTDQAIYEKIANHLISLISSGQIVVGRPLPSEQQLAKEFNVSTGTTKLALARLVELGMAKRVARVGTFVESLAPRRTAPQNSNRRRVALIVPYLPDSYIRNIVEGAERVARGNKVDVILRITDHNEDEERAVLAEVQQGGGIDGLIIYPVNGQHCCDELMQLKLSGYPVVVIDREYRGVKVDTVTPDHFGGAKLAVQHLVELGHRRIGFASIDVAKCSASEMRYWGYLEAMAEAGLALHPEFVLKDGQVGFETKGLIRELFTSQLLLKFGRSDQATALFCANDQLAVEAIDAALAIGLDVPSDLSVIGFSDNEVCAKSPVPVTTIDHGQAITGAQAMELLLRRLVEPTREFERVCLEATLIPRSSTGVPCGLDRCAQPRQS